MSETYTKMAKEGDLAALAARVSANEAAIGSKADSATTYTKSDVDSIVQALKNGSREVMTSLPATGEPMKIYMVAKSASQTNNAYDEYIWTGAGAWEKIGDTEIDLSNYVQKETGKGLFSGSYNDLSNKPTIPTKTSQLANDGDGTNAFVKTNDTRLSDARTPTAHTHAMADVTGLNAALAQKANTSDLPYRLVEPGEWEFSGVPFGFTDLSVVYSSEDGEWKLQYEDGGIPGESAPVIGDGSELSIVFADYSETYHITATRASLPGHLLDRAGNRVVVTGDTTLTLPAANPGYIRDFLVRLEISGSTVPTITFAAPTGETITYETDGDEFPVPDESGTWSYSFTENCVAHKFAVSLKKVNEVAAPQAQGGA